MLGKNSFSSSHIASYDYSLRHPLWATGYEAEELHQQAVFAFPMRQLLRNVVYVKLSLVFEHAFMRLQIWFLSESRFLIQLILIVGLKD
jgi:hypothetical protein